MLAFYFKITSRGQIYGGFLLNFTKILLIFSCCKSRPGVDSKLESVLQAKRNKMKLCVELMKKWEPQHWTLDNSKFEEGQGDYY